MPRTEGMRESKWRLARYEGQICYCEDEYDAACGADGIVLMTEWHQFRGADLKRARAGMRGDLFFDLRNVFSKNQEAKQLFRYYGVGC